MAPVYLLVGEELLVLEAADAVRAMARRLGYAEREVLEADSRFDWDDLARASAGLSLFATQRLLDLRLGGRARGQGWRRGHFRIRRPILRPIPPC